MELISFILMVSVPLGFLAWALTKRGLMAGMAAPFLVMLFFGIYALNTDPVLSYPVSNLGCPSVPLNSTATVDGNVTRTVNNLAPCTYVSSSVNHAIAPEALLIVNYTMLFGETVLAFVVLKRVLEALKAGKKIKQESGA